DGGCTRDKQMRTDRGHFVCGLAGLVLSLFLFSLTAAQTVYTLRSANQKIEIKIRLTDRVRYDVLVNGQIVVQDSTLSLKTESATLGANPKIKNTKDSKVDQWLEPAVPQKSARIHENYNELRLEMEGNYAVVFRAYNEGVAYRFETSLPAQQQKILSEEVGLNFAGDYDVYYPKEDSFFSHNEREFLYLPLKEIAPDSIASLPAVVDTKAGIKIAV